MHLLSNLHTQSSLFMEKKKIYCRSFFYLYLPSLSLKAEGLQKYWCSQITSRFDSAKKLHCSNMISILSHTRNLNLKVIAKYAVRSQSQMTKINCSMCFINIIQQSGKGYSTISKHTQYPKAKQYESNIWCQKERWEVHKQE